MIQSDGKCRKTKCFQSQWNLKILLCVVFFSSTCSRQTCPSFFFIYLYAAHKPLFVFFSTVAYTLSWPHIFIYITRYVVCCTNCLFQRCVQNSALVDSYFSFKRNSRKRTYATSQRKSVSTLICALTLVVLISIFTCLLKYFL